MGRVSMRPTPSTSSSATSMTKKHGSSEWSYFALHFIIFLNCIYPSVSEVSLVLIGYERKMLLHAEVFQAVMFCAVETQVKRCSSTLQNVAMLRRYEPVSAYLYLLALCNRIAT